MRKRMIFLILMLLMILTGVSSCNTLLPFLADNIKVTLNSDEAKDKKAIDSLLISSPPAYWKEPIDSTYSEREFEINGYRIWILQVDGVRRIEIQRKDIKIPIYEK